MPHIPVTTQLWRDQGKRGRPAATDALIAELRGVIADLRADRDALYRR